MPGDFDERLAAVDDALADTDPGTARESAPPNDGERQPVAPDSSQRAGATTADGPTGRATPSTTLRGTAHDAVEARPDSTTTTPTVDTPETDDTETGAPGPVEVSALTDRVAELEAAVQAIRGYTGSVRAVNDRVEERADAALATVESLQDRVDAIERQLENRERGAGRHAERALGDERESRVRPGRDTNSAVTEEQPPTWPPATPREPYGDRPENPDGDDTGLLGRLRNVL